MQEKANTDGLIRLLTHLVDTGKRWDGEAKRLGGLRFDHQFVLGRSLYTGGRHTAECVFGLVRAFPERHGEVCGLCVSVMSLTLLTRTQVVVGAVITRHPARQLRMRIGAADGIDFLYAGRVDSELHD
jgi:hypothetical protein